MKLLRIDSSARSQTSDRSSRGSHTRRLTERFTRRWLQQRPNDVLISRDVGQSPPHPVAEKWIGAAFTKPDQREPWMNEALAESDALINELIAADLVVAGVPMYNFGMPAQFKAYIDNVVRVGRTFGFDRSRPDDPYTPLLAGMDKRHPPDQENDDWSRLSIILVGDALGLAHLTRELVAPRGRHAPLRALLCTGRTLTALAMTVAIFPASTAPAPSARHNRRPATAPSWSDNPSPPSWCRCRRGRRCRRCRSRLLSAASAPPAPRRASARVRSRGRG